MTMWFDRKPGDFASPSTEEDGTLIIGDGPPDWVRLPPDLGGQQLKVLSHHEAKCPKCKTEVPVRHLVLEAQYGVAECKTCGFVWYRQKAAR